MLRHVKLAVVALGVMVAAVAPAQAFHFYRGPAGDCTPADGPTTDDVGASGPKGATIMLLHNTYNDAETGLPETRITVGESVTWTWNSSHCHSVTQGGFDSGFHYPTAAPESPQVVPGFFEYPVPDDTPTLSYTHTFTEPGTYAYACVHHSVIGMNGTIVVDPAGGGGYASPA